MPFWPDQFAGSDSQATVTVTVPPNARGTVRLPAAKLARVTEGGLRVASALGVRAATQEGDDVVVEVGSGSYRFVYDRIAAP